MIKNYIKTAWRSLIRNKGYAAINVTGLAVGIAACLLIFLVVNFETSFDDFHTKRDNIYRVITRDDRTTGDLESGVPFPTAEALRMDFPQLKQVATIMKNKGSRFIVGNMASGQPFKKFKEDDTYFAEPQFFNMFDFKWLAGDKKTALSDPNTVVLSQDEADKFFGNWKDAIGKVIRYQNTTDLKVTGILENVPVNSDFQLKIVVSYASQKVKSGDFYDNRNDWVSVFGSHYVFVQLPANMSKNQFDANLAAFVKKHKPADFVKETMVSQPLNDMHYNTKVGTFSKHTFGKEKIDVLSLIGVFLLVIACVNFINLATAQAVNRSKEVGIRKVLGSNRKQLIAQFISETLIVTVFSVALAAGIAIIALPLLNQLLDIKLSSTFISSPVVLLFLVAVVIGVTLLSGFYPAMVLSGFNPISALKNKIASGRADSGISLRRALVVLQFCIAQVLVIGTLVIISQMNYFRNQSLGFVKDAVINVPFRNDSANLKRLGALRDQLMQQPGISAVSFSFAAPSDNSGWGTNFKYDNSPKKADFEVNLKWADADYFKLYKLEFVAGHAYTKSDSIRQYVVNVTLLKKLGVRNPNEALGKYINLWDDKTKYAQIVGVVKDFNVGSLKDQIPPVLMSSWKDVYQTINIKIQPTNMKQSLASVERLWSSTFPDDVYEYQFLDQKIANFYQTEEQLSQLYKIFAGIAIFISCLGLYGLVSFMAVQRTKEVGIRKTLGASISQIVYLFSKEFTLLILVAFAISAPIGWYFMNKWLQDFTYKIHLGPGIFILAIAVSIAIAWVTVGYKAIQAALVNPVKSLRSE